MMAYLSGLAVIWITLERSRSVKAYLVRLRGADAVPSRELPNVVRDKVLHFGIFIAKKMLVSAS